MRTDLSPMQLRTLAAMRRDRSLTMAGARTLFAYGNHALVAERVATARRINRAIIHYLTHVCGGQS